MPDRAAAVPVFDHLERWPTSAPSGESVDSRRVSDHPVTRRPVSDRPAPPRVIREHGAASRVAPDAGIATGAHAWATGVDVAEAQCLATRLAPEVHRLEQAVRAACPALGAEAVRDHALRLALGEIGVELSRDTFTVLRFNVDRARPVV